MYEKEIHVEHFSNLEVIEKVYLSAVISEEKVMLMKVKLGCTPHSK
jgi:hypothetical protein